ncbi:hypothetical protein [Corynebacterium accolens]|nr:hypothetical protein [Corynebacterium accolens]MDK4294486.1 hypothetical protein [Corynebacterium accolens]
MLLSLTRTPDKLFSDSLMLLADVPSVNRLTHNFTLAWCALQ